MTLSLINTLSSFTKDSSVAIRISIISEFSEGSCSNNLARINWLVMLQLLVFVLNIYGSNSNVIFLDKFPNLKITQNNKSWTNYLDKTSFELLTTVKKVVRKSLLSQLNSYVTLYSRKSMKILKISTNCDSNLEILSTYITGKVCDHNIRHGSYYIRRRDIYPFIGRRDRRLCYKWNHFIQTKLKYVYFKLDQNFMLNLTFFKLNLELSYQCEVEYIGIGEIPILAHFDRTCGRLPQTTYLPDRSENYLVMDVLAGKEPNRIEVQFQIIDPRHVRPICCGKGCYSRISQSHCYYVGSFSSYEESKMEGSYLIYFMFGFHYVPEKRTWQVYLLHIRKFSKMKFSIENERALSRVFDGPYMNNQFVMNPNFDSFYSFSTFQGILQYAIETLNNRTMVFRYGVDEMQSSFRCEAQRFDKMGVINGSAKGLDSCSGSCNCAPNEQNKITFCVIELQASNKSINITFNGVRYRGPNIDHCR